MNEQIGAGIGATVLPSVLATFQTYGVTQYPSLTVTCIETHFETAPVSDSATNTTLQCIDKQGKVVPIPCDFVVTASGARPVNLDTTLFNAQGIEVIKVGDCQQVADIAYAIKTAYDAANLL